MPPSEDIRRPFEAFFDVSTDRQPVATMAGIFFPPLPSKAIDGWLSRRKIPRSLWDHWRSVWRVMDQIFRDHQHKVFDA